MKNLFTFVFFILPISLFAQKKYDSYFMDIPGKGNVEFNISVTDKKGAVDDVYIYAHSLDGLYTNTLLMVSAKKLPVFTQYLVYVRDKFKEWKDAAQSNNVKDFNKNIDVELRDTYKAGFGSSECNVDRGVRIRSIFSVKDGESSLYVTTGKLYSDLNSYIKSDGLVFYYTDPSQMDELISKLDVVKINNFVKDSKDTDSIFK